jgi:predicted secreted Zn-dependent protease
MSNIRKHILALVGVAVLIMFCAVISVRTSTLLNNDYWIELQNTPSVKIVRYKIDGNDKKELRESINKNGPTDNNGKRWDAYTYWKIKWRWPKNENNYSFDKTLVSYNITVHLPELENPNKIDRQTKSNWEHYIQQLVFHELGHVRNILNGVKKLKNNLKEAYLNNSQLTTIEANQIAQQTLAKIRELDQRYDHETNHGQSQGVVFY